MNIERIENKIKENNKKIDLTTLRLAYDVASKAHENQRRKTGELYIQHSLHTAFMLAQMKADLNTVIAGLLHDVPEDTEVMLDDIKKDFGEEIASLVEGITKLSKIKYRGSERYKESLKKMFLAMASDLRIILIKFADRLHNLRTLESLPAGKQERIAKETLEIYAPIAGLLGIWHLKWQMEDICFKYLYPEEYKKIEYKYEVEKKTERNQFIQKVKNILGEELKNKKIDHIIEGRFKHLYSIYLKMQNKKKKFNEIQDVFALRVITSSVSDCYKILGIIHIIWKPKTQRFKDYIAAPKPNGYRSLHTVVFGPEGKSTEFQIRTKKMHDEALYGIAAHWYYKKNADPKNQPSWIKEILELQKEARNTNEFIAKMKIDVFNDRIFVLSPKGDVFELPEKGTPVDFAYAVHTDIGNKTVGVLVNENMAALNHELKDGDVVEILTEKNRKGPNRDWLKFVKTSRARNKIREYAKKSAFENIKKFIPRL